MITIVTGEIRSGKTTLVQELYGNRQGIGGIVAPGSWTDRQVIDIKSGESRPLIASAAEDYVQVGRYRLSQSSLDWSIDALRRVLQDHTVKTIVVDEVGKLELAGGGYASILPELTVWSRADEHELVLIVRDDLVSQVWTMWLV